MPPRPIGCKAKASRINCVSNLKQIGLAFRMWSNDHGEKFPMQSSMFGTNGGTMEFNLTGAVWRHFQMLSNELNTPKVLVCPDDKARSRITDWPSLTNNSHLSYFVGLDGDETRPQTILSGDRSLTGTIKPIKGVLLMSTNNRITWTSEIHKNAGNIALADGSAHQFTTPALARQFQAVFASTTQAVHRLALPE
jgi:prepilin-type processing-associated H-X9-DG protein